MVSVLDRPELTKEGKAGIFLFILFIYLYFTYSPISVTVLVTRPFVFLSFTLHVASIQIQLKYHQQQLKNELKFLL